MPQYHFKCNKCEEYWQKYYSFQEYDEIVLPKKEKCPKCKKPKQVRMIIHAPMINLGATIGAQAEKNTKGLGGKIQEEHLAKQEKKKKKQKKHEPWYGKLGKTKMKEIFSENNQKEKKRKIQKYIREGK